MIKKLTPLPGPTALVHVPIVLTWLSIWSRVGPARRVTLSQKTLVAGLHL